MKRRRSHKAEKPAVPEMDARLLESMLRLGARAPLLIGWWLARLREARGQTVGQQAQALGLTESALACLGVCRPPRPDQREEDAAERVRAHRRGEGAVRARRGRRGDRGGAASRRGAHAPVRHALR